MLLKTACKILSNTPPTLKDLDQSICDFRYPLGHPNLSTADDGRKWTWFKTKPIWKSYHCFVLVSQTKVEWSSLLVKKFHPMVMRVKCMWFRPAVGEIIPFSWVACRLPRCSFQLTWYCFRSIGFSNIGICTSSENLIHTPGKTKKNTKKDEAFRSSPITSRC